MSGLSVTAHNGNQILMDITPWLHPERGGSVTMDRDEHGDASLTASLQTTRQQAARMRSWPDTARLVVSYGLQRVWVGRLEEVQVGDEVKLRAFGPWQALQDVDYTGFWSTRSLAEWRTLTEQDSSNTIAERWQINTNGGALNFAWRKGEAYTAANYAEMGWAAPERSENLVTRITFDYEFTAPNTDYQAGLEWANADWVRLDNLWSIAGNGSTQSGTTTALVFLGFASHLIFWIRLAASATYSGETGDAYLRISNVRLLSKPAPVRLSDVAAGLAAYVNGWNGDQLSASAGLIEQSSRDLGEAVFVDAYPANILTDYVVGEQLEVGASGRAGGAPLLYLRERHKYSRPLYTVGARLEQGRSLAPVRNRMAAVFQDPSGRRQRTAAAVDTASRLKRGVTRSGTIRAQTTLASEAEALRDAALADGVDAERQSAITVTELYNASGGRVQLHDMDAGDELLLRDLPLETVEAISLRAARVRLVVENNMARLDVEPAEPAPSVEVLLASAAD
ncbi:MAG: hypothetical protein R6X32_06135 [Chloroflexota bacterium]